MSLGFFLYKLKRIVGMRIYCNDTVLLMELKTSLHQKSPAAIKPVTPENITDASYFQSKRQILTFKKFLKNGDHGYYAYLNNNCIHRSWVVIGDAHVLLHKFYSMPITADEVFVQFCETAEEARGKNIFSHVLCHISEQYTSKRILTSVDSKNASSIRSMKKAGFETIALIKIKVILGIKFISREQPKREV